jgi:hypothetical protein
MNARDSKKASVRFGCEWWPEPMEQAHASVVFGSPAGPSAADVYEVDVQVLARWEAARREYLQARAALVGEIERQGWRAPPRPEG